MNPLEHFHRARALPFIVAEIGANHNGSLERALQLITAAAKAGADAVKFQTWSAGSMVLDPTYAIKGGPWAGQLLAQLYETAETPWRWHETLFASARSHGLVPFCSVFDVGALVFLETQECPMYKIASFEIEDLALIRACARTGKPLILSTGMASETTVRIASNVALNAGCEDLTLLHCVSAYPAPVAAANLYAMASLRMAPQRLYFPAVGLSDHTLGIHVPIAATVMGATMIEKHLTLSRAEGGLDAGFSLEPEEFAAMVHGCRQARLALGSEKLERTPEEADSQPLKRSLYWGTEVLAGSLIVDEAYFVTARPALGLSPLLIPQLLNRKLKVGVSRGTPVSWAQFA